MWSKEIIMHCDKCRNVFKRGIRVCAEPEDMGVVAFEKNRPIHRVVNDKKKQIRLPYDKPVDKPAWLPKDQCYPPEIGCLM
jgi:hypothetical protein